ncbi:hypothetical protein N9937_01085 [bacterium]|nr:hypothetical protein [bacterium]
MLTVWSVCWGDKYDDYCVQRLQREVARNLNIEHEFICITDRQIEGVKCIPPINDLPGWWGKVNLFAHEVCADQNLYLDLDVVITRCLDELVMRYQNCSLAMPSNWAQSGHGGCQSSVMMWKKNYNNKQIHDLFDHANAHWPPVNKPGVLWGDQEWITHLRDTHKVSVNPIIEGIKSYKYHCQNGLPDESVRIVVFHGDPKPSSSSVNESWYTW